MLTELPSLLQQAPPSNSEAVGFIAAIFLYVARLTKQQTIDVLLAGESCSARVLNERAARVRQVEFELQTTAGKRIPYLRVLRA